MKRNTITATLMDNYNVVILDDHSLISIGIEKIMKDFDGFNFLSGFTIADDLCKFLEIEDTDILLLDIDLPGEDTKCIIEKVLQLQPELKVLLYSGTESPKVVDALVYSGVKGFISKYADDHEMCIALDMVASGGIYFDSKMSSQIIWSYLDDKEEKNPLNVLTEREIEILQLIGESHTNNEIAKKLHLSSRTVDTHRYNIIKKLGVKNIVGALKLGYKHNIL